MFGVSSGAAWAHVVMVTLLEVVVRADRNVPRGVPQVPLPDGNEDAALRTPVSLPSSRIAKSPLRVNGTGLRHAVHALAPVRRDFTGWAEVVKHWMVWHCWGTARSPLTCLVAKLFICVQTRGLCRAL